MRLCVKKIYCPSCQKLVKGNEEKINGNTQVLCSRCGRHLYLWNGVTWRYVSEGA